MSTQELPVFDCDNHYYEAIDAFTRHLDPRTADRTVQWCEIGGRKHHIVGGKLARAVANPTFDPIAKPGALYDFLRGNGDGASARELMRDREPIPDYYLHADARVKKLDEQGVEGCWLFPTLGILYEELLKHDPQAVQWTFRAFNRWLEDDWGLNYHDRIYAAPYISLCDVAYACEELEWALERDARVICMRPAAAWTETGPLSPADEYFDPFWARVNEAGITVVAHAADSGYTTHGYARDGFGATFESGSYGRPSIKAFNIERAAYDFLLTLVFDRLFERFPNLRVASVENGSEYLPDLFRKLNSFARKASHWFEQHPLETFKQHVWINPFWEDDVNEVASYMGTDRVIFGSEAFGRREGGPSCVSTPDSVMPRMASATRVTSSAISTPDSDRHSSRAYLSSQTAPSQGPRLIGERAAWSPQGR